MCNRIFCCLTVVMMIFAGGVSAELEKPLSLRKSPAAIWTDERSFDHIVSAFELLSNQRYAEAEIRFETLARYFKSSYEKSEALRGLAQAYLLQSKNEPAVLTYERIVTLNALPNAAHYESMAQLAGIYQEQQKYTRALALIKQVVAQSEQPKRDWFELKLTLHHELNELSELRSVLRSMIKFWPEDKTLQAKLEVVDQAMNSTEPPSWENLEALVLHSVVEEPAALHRVSPTYPRRAGIAKVEGFVTVEFMVDEVGHVVDPVVVEAKPPRTFNRSALDAISKWKFKPSLVNGQVVVRRATQTFDFKLAGR